MARGFVYLTPVVDVASRKVLAHRVAITLEACHAKEVLELALARYGVPEIVNTDQGSQLTAEEFTSVVLAAGCKLSMDGRGAWRDNMFVERVWRSVKYEPVYLEAYDSVSAARARSPLINRRNLFKQAEPLLNPSKFSAAPLPDLSGL